MFAVLQKFVIKYLKKLFGFGLKTKMSNKDKQKMDDHCDFSGKCEKKNSLTNTSLYIHIHK